MVDDWNSLFVERGMPHRCTVDRLNGNTTTCFLKELGLTSSEIDELVVVRKERYLARIKAEQVEIYLGAQELFPAIRANKLQLGLVTMCKRPILQIEAEKEPNLFKSFQVVLTGEAFPDKTTGYMQCAEFLRVTPATMVVLEDGVRGAKSARQAGCSVITVTHTTPRELLLPYSDVVVDTLSEVATVLNLATS